MNRIVHCKKKPYDVYIGRGSKWGNPWTHIADRKTKAQFIVKNRKEAIEKYREWITEGDGKYLLEDLHELKDKVLGCYCFPKRCHGEVLLELLAKRYNGELF